MSVQKTEPIDIQDLLSIIATKTAYYPRQSRTGWKSRCPAHDDTTPSLSISVGFDEKILFKCFSGCTYKDICDS